MSGDPTPSGVPGRDPLSFAQERLWFIDRLDPGNPAYNLSAGWRIEGTVDETALATAFQALVDRHEVLRTAIRGGDGRPWQQVCDGVTATPETVDLTALGPGEREEELERIGRREAARRFDLARPPLIRMCLVRLAPDAYHLFFVAHHIAVDGWSLSILVRDLLTVHDAVVSGRGPELPPLPLTYRAYAADHRERLSGEERERLLTYWRGALSGMPTVLDLPADRPRPPRAGHRGGLLRFDIDPELTARLHDLARRERVTLFMALVAAVQTVLHRYTGQADIPVGTPISHRPDSRLENAVGLFLNTLVLRGTLESGQTFSELLARTRATAMDAYAHQELPFETLVGELEERRDLSRNPLVQVMVSFQNTPRLPAGTADRGLRRTTVDTGYTKVDLNLGVTEEAGRLRCDLYFARDLFDTDRMERFRDHLTRLLAEVAADPGQRIDRIPLLGPDEHAFIEAHNASVRDYPRTPLPVLVAQQAERTPGATALIHPQGRLTYREFTDRVDRLAGRLRALGAGPDRVVGVLLERGADLLVAVHAVQAAGAAYLPLEPGYPAERLRYMLKDAGAAAVVTSEALAAEPAPFGPLPVVRIDTGTDAPAVDAGSAAPPCEPPAPDDLAYVIYTSGSTGRPKGVAVTHEAISNRIQWMQEEFPLTAEDRVLHKTPFGFDVSVWELFWPLTVGAAVVVAPPGSHRSPGDLAELVERERVSVLHFVPSMLDAALETPGFGPRLRSVRHLFCSGEALPLRLAARTVELLPQVRLHNLYGPTEAAVDVSFHPHEELAGTPADTDEASAPIGRPVANTRLEILDPHLQRVPAGIPGELCLGGVQLARGYLGRPALTAERFVPSPYGPEGARLYRTGDLARRRADGTVEFLGRLDHQVKINGQRIEPGEIEAAFGREPELRTSAVLPRTDHTGLVAYLVPHPGRRAAAEQIDWSARLRRRLPAFMVPDRTVVLDALPVTANGKLDRAALLRTAAPDSRPGTAYSAPRGPAEAAIAAVWADVLGLARVGAEDNFFTLGGDSIRTIKVVARLQPKGYEADLEDLFTHPTVRELARVVRPAPATPPAGARPAAPSAAFGLLGAEDLARLTSGKNGV